MNISETISFDKVGVPLWRKLFLSIVIILVASLSFAIGRLTREGKSEPIKIEYDQSLTSTVINSNENSASVIASKNGKKYHYPFCPGAKQISEKNKIIFASKEAAEASGYTLAANCKAP